MSQLTQEDTDPLFKLYFPGEYYEQDEVREAFIKSYTKFFIFKKSTIQLVW